MRAAPPPRCYVIAAIDLAHNGEFSTARKLIEVAVESGCDAVKLQRRSVDHLVVSDVLHRPFVALPEFGSTYREVFRRLEFGDDEYVALKAACEGRLDFLVAPFDLPSLAATAPLGVDAYRVESPCATDVPLLEALAGAGRRVVASVGACSPREVGELVRVLRACDLTLLYSVAADPAPIEALNLNAMGWLRQFGCAVGFADTSEGGALGPVAVALGARMVEKRITLNRTGRGFHHAVSLAPDELRRYVLDIRGVERALDKPPAVDVHPCEAAVHDEERKSVVAAEDLLAGTVLTREMLACKAPLRGLTPSFLAALVGRRLVYDLKRDEPITFGMFE